MRQMRQMNSMMNTMFADPFGMMGDMGMLMGPSHNSMMPYMPDGMMNMNRMMNGIHLFQLGYTNAPNISFQ